MVVGERLERAGTRVILVSHGHNLLLLRILLHASLFYHIDWNYEAICWVTRHSFWLQRISSLPLLDEDLMHVDIAILIALD